MQSIKNYVISGNLLPYVDFCNTYLDRKQFTLYNLHMYKKYVKIFNLLENFCDMDCKVVYRVIVKNNGKRVLVDPYLIINNNVIFSSLYITMLIKLFEKINSYGYYRTIWFKKIVNKILFGGS